MALGWKQFLQRIPGVGFAYHFASSKYASLTGKKRPTDVIFTEIFQGNKFRGEESISGPGSDLLQTRVIRSEISVVFRELTIQKMLDIPCGDFHWMRHVNLENVEYTGADIVTDLIQRNSQFEAPNVRFCMLDLIKDRLPKVDLVFCRDCLVHLSNKNMILALRNICNSGSHYLLTTTFPTRQHNRDIVTGQWRPLNLEAKPFFFPPPLKLINEECTEENGKYADKSLGLWRISQIEECLNARCAAG